MFANFQRTLAVGAVAFAVFGGMHVDTVQAAEKEIIEYRLKDWKTVEFEDAKKAKTHFDTVKKLGCEARQEDHNGHIDVSYRCPKWRQISLKSHADAHNWERWLEASGFETKHVH